VITTESLNKLIEACRMGYGVEYSTDEKIEVLELAKWARDVGIPALERVNQSDSGDGVDEFAIIIRCASEALAALPKEARDE